MSGHSKWAQIKRSKGLADAKRGALFTKLARAISLAARQGGGNPETNFKLRLAIEKAKQANMPKENIERAIKRGTGELSGATIEKVVYEAFGPGGVAMVIEVLTDNKNRAVANLKHILNKYQGRLGEPKSVLWMFETKGVIRLSESGKPEDKEKIELKAIELGAEDIKEENGEIIIFTLPENLQKIKEGLEQEGFSINYAEVEMIAKNKVKVEDAGVKQKLEKLYLELDECQEVDNYYTNEE